MGRPEKGSRRYPHLRVALRSEHPLALVAAVRQELRRAGIDSDEIEHFSREALSDDDPERARQICAQWVDVDPRGPDLA
jgi:SOS response regulatory protein OraA/RecX